MDVFVHIPKTAGSTIRSIISRQYGVDQTLYFEPDSDTWEYRDDPTGYLSREMAARPVQLITGHHRFGVHEFVKRPCRYFSLVRDPIDRVLSDYFYAFTFPDHRHRDGIRDGSFTIQNFIHDSDAKPAESHTYLLAGVTTHLEGPARMAIENINNSFAAIGTAEDFNASMLYIAKRMGWAPPIYLRRNVTPMDAGLRARRKEALASLQAGEMDAFESDYAVYNAVKTRMTAWIESEGESFRRAYASFQTLQAELARMETDAIYEEYKLVEDEPLPPAAQELMRTDAYLEVQEYLAGGATDAEDLREYVGYVDRRDSEAIGGWAFDFGSQRPLHVALRKNGAVIEHSICHARRPDVAQTGFFRDQTGFSFDVEGYPDIDSLVVTYEDTLIQVPFLRSL